MGKKKGGGEIRRTRKDRHFLNVTRIIREAQCFSGTGTLNSFTSREERHASLSIRNPFLPKKGREKGPKPDIEGNEGKRHNFREGKKERTGGGEGARFFFFSTSGA